jgi:hypothetical protein
MGGARYPAGPPYQWPAWAPAPAPKPPARPQRDDSRRRSLLLAAAVVAVIALVGVAVLIMTGDDGDETAASSTSESTEPNEPNEPNEVPPSSALPTVPFPSMPGLPGSTDPEAFARPLDEILPELISFVEVTRGHTFKDTPVVEAVDDEEFERRLLEAQAEEEDELAVEEVADQALGIIPPGTDLVEVAREAGAAGVLGFYLPSDGELLVKGEVITPFVATVIVHELTHALDDQYFDLSRIDALVTRPDESAFGMLALVEGTAKWVETQYREQLSADERGAVEAEEFQLGIEQSPLIMQLPLPYLVKIQVPYGNGLVLADAIATLSPDPPAGFDAAYEDPPVTSEQVLDPGLYEAGQPSVEVPDVAASGSTVDYGEFGVADLRLMEVAADPLSAIDSLEAGLEPLPGFGGGQFASWREPNRSCIRFVLVGDTEQGSSAITELVREWADAVGGARVTVATGPGGFQQTEASRCA